MRINDGTVLSGTAEIREQLERLVHVKPGEGFFVSCYLDMRAGRNQASRFLVEQSKIWRERLPEAVRPDLHQALRSVRAEVARPWHQDVNGLAVFVHGRHLSCVATASVLSNRLNVYDIPDVLPLIDLLQRERRFVVARADGEAPIGFTDVDAGVCTSHMLSKDVLGIGNLPIVIAGDDATSNRVAAWLSEGSHRGPVHLLKVSDGLDEQVVFAQAGRLIREHSRWQADGKARRIARAALKSLPDVVAGAAASRAMLRAGLVKTLLVVPDLVRSAGWHCASCDETVGISAAPALCPRCEDTMRPYYQPLTELVRMASLHGVEVLVSTMDELRKLGGVACLLAEPAERHLMPAPALVRPVNVAA